MVGVEVLHQLLSNEKTEQVVSIGRSASGIKHPKLREIKHQNFLNFSSLEKNFSESNVCFYCLGVYQTRVPKDRFWEITVDYLRALIRTLERVNKKITFCLFSAQGADQSERTPLLFGKAKGRAEKKLLESGVKKVYIFRPGFINPGRKSAMKGLSLWAIKPFYKIFPFIGIDAFDLAKVMIYVGVNGSEINVFENKSLRKLAEEISKI